MAVEQNEAFAAGVEFAKAEGIVPAPESTHGIAGALAEARKHTGEPGSRPSIVIGLSGHGFLDLPAYESYVHGDLG